MCKHYPCMLMAPRQADAAGSTTLLRRSGCKLTRYTTPIRVSSNLTKMRTITQTLSSGSNDEHRAQ
jgi:hypothetical protein